MAQLPCIKNSLPFKNGKKCPIRAKTCPTAPIFALKEDAIVGRVRRQAATVMYAALVDKNIN